MNNINLSKKTIAIAAVLILLAIVGFASCSGGDKKSNDNNSQSSILVPDTTSGSQIPIATNKKTTTLPTYVKEPFSIAAQKNLYSLATTGILDPARPGNYISPRYEGIIGGDTSSGVPISELDNPVNSDLDAATFKNARDNTIAITKALITGEGAANYPSYFVVGNEPGNCTKFVAKNTGAISLPIPNDSRWIVGIIFWSATCGSAESGTYKVAQQTQVYFTNNNGTLTPRQYSEVPGA